MIPVVLAVCMLGGIGMSALAGTSGGFNTGGVSWSMQTRADASVGWVRLITNVAVDAGAFFSPEAKTFDMKPPSVSTSGAGPGERIFERA